MAGATRTWRLLIVVVALGVAAAIPRAQDKRPVTHEALWLMPRVGAPAVSPDGKSVVFSVVQPAYDDKDQQSDLWIVPADGSAPPRRLTSTKAAESGVAWSADSRRIAFSTKREGDEANQIYALDLASGGEARPRDVDFDRRGVARVAARRQSAAVHQPRLPQRRRRCGEPEGGGRTQRTRNTKSGRTTRFPIRHWDRWLDDRQIHVFVQSLDAGTKAMDLLAGTRLVQSPGYSGRRLDTGEELDAVWAPDGAVDRLRRHHRRTTAAYAAVHTQLFQVPAAGGEPRQLTHGDVTYEHPRFRPDGRAFYFTCERRREADLRARSPGDGAVALAGPATPTVLSKTFDRICRELGVHGGQPAHLPDRGRRGPREDLHRAGGRRRDDAGRGAAARRLHQSRHRTGSRRRIVSGDRRQLGQLDRPRRNRPHRSGDERTIGGSTEFAVDAGRRRSTGSRPSTSGSPARAGAASTT